MHRIGGLLRIALCFNFLAFSYALAQEGVEKTPAAQYQHGGIHVPAATAEEAKRESVSVSLAEKYLEEANAAWNGKHQCISCHTNGTYMVARPALAPTLGKPGDGSRQFFVSELKSLLAEPQKKLQRGVAPAQVIYLAAGLAEWDVHVTQTLSKETDQALRLMFALQREHGSWGTQDCWPPYESDAYHLASVAAMAATAAPGWIDAIVKEQDKQLLTQLDKLQKYLRTQSPHDYGRTLLLWAAARMPGLVDQTEKKKLIQMLLAHQQSDGGWSIRTMAEPEAWGRGNRAEKIRSEPRFDTPESDGHMTGLAMIVLREAGVGADAIPMKRGLSWLTSNQRQSGRWWTRSLNTDGAHYITYSGTAFPLLALQMCDMIPEK
ncbi:MAG: hypothetical protein P8M53_09485 [Pirellulales bacterium]|nr:hypothetical protein [Pirellulales bacterium]